MFNCKMTNYFRGGGDLLRQLHNLAEAECNLAEHHKKLSAIEAKVYRVIFDAEKLLFLLDSQLQKYKGVSLN